MDTRSGGKRKSVSGSGATPKGKKTVKAKLQCITTGKSKRNWAEEVEHFTSESDSEFKSPQATETKMSDGGMADIVGMLQELKQSMTDLKVSFGAQEKSLQDVAQKIGAVETKVGKQEKRLDDHEERLKNLEKRLTNDEIQKSKRGLVLMNVPEEETKENTTTRIVKKICREIGMEEGETCGIEAWRIRVKKQEGKPSDPKKPAPVIVKMRDLVQKSTFMGCAKNLRKTPYNKINYRHEVPKHMIEEAKNLEKECYQIRQGNKDAKTRIAWKGNKLVAQIKKPGEDSFKELSK